VLVFSRCAVAVPLCRPPPYSGMSRFLTPSRFLPLPAFRFSLPARQRSFPAVISPKHSSAIVSGFEPLRYPVQVRFYEQQIKSRASMLSFDFLGHVRFASPSLSSSTLCTLCASSLSSTGACRAVASIRACLPPSDIQSLDLAAPHAFQLL
jgi:hypothetical protein